MILSWMLASVVLALLAGAAARAVESASRLMSWQGRAPWIVAIAASVTWPFIVPLLAARRIVHLAPVVIGTGGVVRGVAAQLPSLPAGVTSRLDAVLIGLWVVASTAILLRLARTHRALGRMAASAR
ncbi:MAG: hypothetical protein ACHQSE_03105, partial [Gemmatimonadales bacterium]